MKIYKNDSEITCDLLSNKEQRYNRYVSHDIGEFYSISAERISFC
jgi:hypothetical protein